MAVPARVRDEIDAQFRALVDDDALPGLCYGVVDRTGLVHSRGHGVVRANGPCPDATTAFRIASMSKSFTAAATMMLVEQGALGLADPVSRYVPEFGGLPPDSPEVTVEMLLTMSAGLPTDDPWADRQESMSRESFGRLLTQGVRFIAAPGTRYEYSNLGYVLLGCAIETVSGLPYRRFVEERLLGPLGMTSTGFDRSVPAAGGVATGHSRLDGCWQEEAFSGPGVFSPMAGLFSTIEDLARWVAWLADAFPARDGEGAGPLGRASRRAMQQVHRVMQPPRRRTDDDTKPARIMGYGYGLMVRHDPVWGPIVSHGGGYPGFGSHMRWHPETGLGVIVTTNARYVTGTAKATAALRILLEETSPAPAMLWPETIEARAVVERLLREWDAVLADAWFTDNVAMDLDLEHRRTQIKELTGKVGPLLAPEPLEELIRSDSPAHAIWPVRGEHGTLRCEIRLSPQNPPKIQTLKVTAEPATP